MSILMLTIKNGTNYLFVDVWRIIPLEIEFLIVIAGVLFMEVNSIFIIYVVFFKYICEN